jgi:hypothetical protein
LGVGSFVGESRGFAGALLPQQRLRTEPIVNFAAFLTSVFKIELVSQGSDLIVLWFFGGAGLMSAYFAGRS